MNHTEDETLPNPNAAAGTGPSQRAHNPWKTGVIATGVAVTVLAAAGFTFAAFNNSGGAADTAATAPPVSEIVAAQTAATEPPVTTAAATREPVAAQPAPVQAAPAPRENCTVHLAGTQRDTKRVVKDSAIGAVVGAGTGAAGGAIADGGSGAGKGAGIGAVVGAVAGAFHGLSEENERSAAAERAYEACLARNG